MSSARLAFFLAAFGLAVLHGAVGYAGWWIATQETPQGREGHS